MWILFLNDMRSSKIEILKAVCKASTKEELLAFIAKETVAPYTDKIENPIPDTEWQCYPKSWGKSFRKGGPLEWYNPPYDHEADRHFRHMKTLEEVIADNLKMIEQQMRAQLTDQYAQLVTNLPDVKALT